MHTFANFDLYVAACYAVGNRALTADILAMPAVSTAQCSVCTQTLAHIYLSA